MGGGTLHEPGGQPGYKNVWSMTGGPYCNPRHWRRNTAIAMAGIFIASAFVAVKSAELEEHTPPIRPIPSQRWCKNFGDAPPK